MASPLTCCLIWEKLLIAGEIANADAANAANGEDAYMILVDYDYQ